MSKVPSIAQDIFAREGQRIVNAVQDGAKRAPVVQIKNVATSIFESHSNEAEREINIATPLAVTAEVVSTAANVVGDAIEALSPRELFDVIKHKRSRSMSFGRRTPTNEQHLHTPTSDQTSPKHQPLSSTQIITPMELEEKHDSKTEVHDVMVDINEDDAMRTLVEDKSWGWIAKQFAIFFCLCITVPIMIIATILIVVICIGGLNIFLYYYPDGDGMKNTGLWVHEAFFNLFCVCFCLPLIIYAYNQPEFRKQYPNLELSLRQTNISKSIDKLTGRPIALSFYDINDAKLKQLSMNAVYRITRTQLHELLTSPYRHSISTLHRLLGWHRDSDVVAVEQGKITPLQVLRLHAYNQRLFGWRQIVAVADDPIAYQHEFQRSKGDMTGRSAKRATEIRLGTISNATIGENEPLLSSETPGNNIDSGYDTGIIPLPKPPQRKISEIKSKKPVPHIFQRCPAWCLCDRHIDWAKYLTIKAHHFSTWMMKTMLMIGKYMVWCIAAMGLGIILPLVPGIVRSIDGCNYTNHTIPITTPINQPTLEPISTYYFTYDSPCFFGNNSSRSIFIVIWNILMTCSYTSLTIYAPTVILGWRMRRLARLAKIVNNRLGDVVTEHELAMWNQSILCLLARTRYEVGSSRVVWIFFLFLCLGLSILVFVIFTFTHAAVLHNALWIELAVVTSVLDFLMLCMLYIASQCRGEFACAISKLQQASVRSVRHGASELDRPDPFTDSPLYEQLLTYWQKASLSLDFDICGITIPISTAFSILLSFVVGDIVAFLISLMKTYIPFSI